MAFVTKEYYLSTPSAVEKELDIRTQRKLSGWDEFEEICNNPPKKYENEAWLGLQVVKYKGGKKFSGLIDKRYK